MVEIGCRRVWIYKEIFSWKAEADQSSVHILFAYLGWATCVSRSRQGQATELCLTVHTRTCCTHTATFSWWKFCLGYCTYHWKKQLGKKMQEPLYTKNESCFKEQVFSHNAETTTLFCICSYHPSCQTCLEFFPSSHLVCCDKFTKLFIMPFSSPFSQG